MHAVAYPATVQPQLTLHFVADSVSEWVSSCTSAQYRLFSAINCRSFISLCKCCSRYVLRPLETTLVNGILEADYVVRAVCHWSLSMYQDPRVKANLGQVDQIMAVLSASKACISVVIKYPE